MIAKLRKRVIIITMIAVLVVLTLLMGIVNVANYVNTNRQVDEILNLLEENGGGFALFGGGKHGYGHNRPDGFMTLEGEFPEGEFPGEEITDGESPREEMADGEFPEGEFPKGEKGEKDDGLRPGMSEETPYETRYFSVTLDSEDNPVAIDTSRIAAVDEEKALELARSLCEAKDKTAFIKTDEATYRYRIASVYPENSDDGEETNRLFIFVDASRSIDSVKNFLRTSLLVSLVGLIAIAILVVLLSPIMVRPIAESYEKQKKFITNASHELKTPMAVIKSCNEVVEMENGSSKWTQAIGEQVDRLSELTGQLVALSKMDEAVDAAVKGNAKVGESDGGIVKEEVDLAALMAEALEPFALMAEQKGLGFAANILGTDVIGADVENDGNEPLTESLMTRGNRDSLTELINILADNAIKYCSPGGKIRFELNRKGGKVALSEENPAEGLTKGNMNILFDRFYRGDQSHSKVTDREGTPSSSADTGKTGGYGIGLSMAQAIVNAHGGTISATSPDGERLIIEAIF